MRPIDFVTLENFGNTEGIEKEGHLTATWSSSHSTVYGRGTQARNTMTMAPPLGVRLSSHLQRLPCAQLSQLHLSQPQSLYACWYIRLLFPPAVMSFSFP